MPYQLDVTLRTNQAAQIQATVGSGATLVIYSGAEPSNTAAASPTGLLVTMSLPATFLSTVPGAAVLAGTWSGVASAAGTAASWRIFDSTGVCRLQGDVVSNLVLSSNTFIVGQVVQVVSFVHTMGNS